MRSHRARRALFLAAAFFWAPAVWAAPKLVVTFLDVGQGDAAVLQTPGGKTILIDAGPVEPWNEYDAGRDVVVPFLEQQKIKKIDAAVMSHAHLDHLGGFAAVLEKYPVAVFYDPGLPHSTPEYQALLKLLLDKSVNYKIVRAGDALPLDPALEISVLGPPRGTPSGQLNDNSLVLRVRHGRAAFLFTGDIEKNGEGDLVEQFGKNLESRVLKAPHHGSKTSSTAGFLAAARPRLAVISCGAMNRYNHPSPVVLERYKKARVKIHRTDLQGPLQITSNGRGIRAKRLKARKQREE